MFYNIIIDLKLNCVKKTVVFLLVYGGRDLERNDQSSFGGCVNDLSKDLE